ncbi:polysaccharide pyruvyl transferase family protein [Jannaschia seohaensis]|uniref:Polysaccharide pyruvyl transferase WcaK-like protein n=1 Tax=Jannaschia seohaensis TaxID=475081 RepID=A0A2Y9C8Y4_9RHOB|nr:polysaccharide pyruvyl transferase family protein [Jannaschia seohaensis]PWJ12895.1 polysaccharide pyruvyl transferase WcaK-like protein [Jannaschia seohaensis]SSA50703.1 Polysaccharide pyruvyl transferase family protein WcaK [Jannaschia seohaensis]
MTQPPLTIGLFWHSMNSDNLGIGALTVSNVEILRRVAAGRGRAVRFLLLTWRDPRPWYFEAPDIEDHAFRRRALLRPGGPVGAAIARCDLIVDIGAGDSFTDIYGRQRFTDLWVSKLRTRLAGVPLVLAPQTIGPFEGAGARMLARRAIGWTRLAATRDAPSSRALEALAPGASALEATDVAMGLPYDPPAPRAPGGPVRVGVNVSGLLFNGGYTGANQFGLKADYPALIRALLGWFHARPEVELHLVGHVQSRQNATEDDHRVGEALAAEFPGARVAPFFGAPSEAKSYIAGMDFFTGARMHATVAAFSSGVPVIPMAYSRKFAGLFGTLGYDHVADCRTEDADEIVAKIVRGYEDRAALARDVARGRAQVEARLARYAEALGAVLDEIAPRADASAGTA